MVVYLGAERPQSNVDRGWRPNLTQSCQTVERSEMGSACKNALLLSTKTEWHRSH